MWYFDIFVLVYILHLVCSSNSRPLAVSLKTDDRCCRRVLLCAVVMSLLSLLLLLFSQGPVVGLWWVVGGLTYLLWVLWQFLAISIFTYSSASILYYFQFPNSFEFGVKTKKPQTRFKKRPTTFFCTNPVNYPETKLWNNGYKSLKQCFLEVKVWRQRAHCLGHKRRKWRFEIVLLNMFLTSIRPDDTTTRGHSWVNEWVEWWVRVEWLSVYWKWMCEWVRACHW